MQKLPTLIRRTAPLAAVAFALALPAAASASPDFTPATTLAGFGSPTFGYAAGEETGAHYEILSVSPIETRVVVTTRRPGRDFAEQLVIPSEGGNLPLDPSLAVAPNGAALVAWSELQTAKKGTPSRFRAAYRTPDGNWGQPVTIADDDQPGAGDAKVAIGPDGTAVALAEHVETDSPGEKKTDQRIDAVVHGPSGGWDSPTRLSAPDESANGADAGVDAAGNVSVTYGQRYAESPDLFSAVLRRRTASNAVWATAEDLTDPVSPTNAGGPALAVAPDGRAVIALQANENGSFEAFAAVRESASADFGKLVRVGPDADSSAVDDAAIAPDGTAYVLYDAVVSGPDGSHAGMVRALRGGGFSGAQRVSSRNAQIGAGAIAFSGNDAVAAWGATTSDGHSIQATRWGAGSPTPDTFHDLEAPNDADSFEEIAGDGEGGVVIAWAQNELTSLFAHVAAFDGGAPADGDASVPSAATVGEAVPMKASFADRWSALAAGPQWSFGDGAEASGGSVDHVYAAAGDYTVTVRSADVLGNTRERTFPIHVSASTPAGRPAGAAPKVKLKAAKCSRKGSLRTCLLRGTAKGAARVQVTVKRHGSKTRMVKASLKGGKWTAKVKRLKAGTTTFTVRGFASDGSASARVAKKVRLR